MNNESAPNAQRLLWAGFFAIFAAGVGFSVRAGILGDWASNYGFTRSELGGITGGGLTGFGVIILIGSLLADKVGYGRLMGFALVMHLLSAGLQMCTDQIYAQFGREGVYWSLYVAMFLFAIGNGVCEAVVNPMVATLFPREKTHYLNILHAGWPGGLIAGGLLSYFMNGGALGGFQPWPNRVHWLIQMSMFLIPVVIYGLMVLGQHFPKSEAGEAGVGFSTMLLEFTSGVLLLLLLIHALVGYVELGTDSWIARITGSIMNSPTNGLLLFVYTSGLMFALRFFGGPIEHRLSPLGLLFISGVLGSVGLYLLGNAEGVVMCVVAATIYALGKTFLWPTMLAVVSERFPKGGALTIGAVGGVGMLSAGLLGGPGIGFKQDYNASDKLKEISPASYQRYHAEKEAHFLTFSTKGLDGGKVAALDFAAAIEDAKKEGKSEAAAEAQKELNRVLEQPGMKEWWATAESKVNEDRKPIDDAGLYGGRMALTLTAAVPATMAVLYLLLILYFQTQGGYKKVEIHGSHGGGH